MRPELALVPGEPAGIGPELCVRLVQQPREDCRLLAFADPDTLRAAAAALNLPLQLLPEDAEARVPGDLRLRVVANATPSRFGQVTGPVHKAVINEGGIAYSGTTELLADQAGVKVVMMLANHIVRVALATTHLPLREVADAITTPSLEHTLRTVHAALRREFGLPAPRIAVLGLNPHAGEDGHLGREELDLVIPLLQRLRAEGMDLIGPLPADTAFLPAKLAGFDTVLAMYHDQGLPVLKYSGFEQAVNLTLGLPYPRVAVDHGTALDLAGRGVADPSSLQAATTLCAQLARQRTLSA